MEEQNFYKSLPDLFIGIKSDNYDGFSNLTNIKSKYYNSLKDFIQKDIEMFLEKYPNLKDELFDKLYLFFSNYFTENGSICYNSKSLNNNIYEKVYSNNKEVSLSWKTQILYYVKTDMIFKNLLIEFNGLKFYFDVSKVQSKRSNEKRFLNFKLKEINKENIIIFEVYCLEKETIKFNDILEEIKSKGITITEKQLKSVFRKFKKNTLELDFFINKNAKAFLEEQFKLWISKYFFEKINDLNIDKIEQFQLFKDITFKIIDFISQFENELVKIWNKPKFVKSSNYVITLDRIKDTNFIGKILKHQNIKEQIKEWQELGIIEENFNVDDVFETDLTDKHLVKKYEHLPIDTKYFKDLELEILSQFEDLDKSLDGWLIKSENYQALNTILPKFKEKVQTTYIDPPFNTGNDFSYVDRFQNSSWLSLMNDRIKLNKDILKKEGVFLLHLNEKSNYYGKLLLNDIFNEYINEIIWHYFMGGKTKRGFSNKHDSILIYAKDKSFYFNDKVLDSFRYLFVKPSLGSHKDIEELKCDKCSQGQKIWKSTVKKDDVWDISGVFNMANEFYDFDTQKPELLLKNIIESFSEEGNFVLDNFCGLGTTIAVAHKLKRKWIGIEMGYHINDFYIDNEIKKIGINGRMKQILTAKGKNEPGGISKDIKWQGGGFFKYYELEQYEETLANCKYGNSKINFDEQNLCSNIDIPETLSNFTGKWIKKISNSEIEFEDGTKIDIKNLDYKLIKSLIQLE